MKAQFIIILFFLLGSVAALGQDYESYVEDEYYNNNITIRAFDEDVWKKAKKDIDYTPLSEKKKEKKKSTSPRQGNEEGEESTSNVSRDRNYNNWHRDKSKGGTAGFFKILLITLGIVFLGFLIYRLMGATAPTVQATAKENQNLLVDIVKTEENLHKSDMEILIDKALAKGDYALATRLHYLWAIKELSQKRIIRWKRDKTNRDYLREIKKSDLSLHTPFRNITRIFERVWYGNEKKISREDYLTFQPQLSAFIQQIQKKKTQ